MWYLFHGPNVLARNEEIARMKAKLGDAEMASLNTTVIERDAPVRDLIAACDALPFLTDRRLVVASNWLGSVAGAKPRKKGEETGGPLQTLLAYLPAMPDSTRLVFAEDATLSDSHPLIKLAADKANGGLVRHYGLPADPTRWIIERAKSKGSDISPQAAQLLSVKINRGNSSDRDHFDSDSRTYLLKLDNELDKLVSYALGRRIESRDVALLAQDEDVADIFKFVDAVSARDADVAYQVMRSILGRGESPLVALAHIARQTRLLMQAKEHPDLGPEQLAQTIGAHPFVARKVLQQASRFSMDELERAHVALLEADLAVKTGRMDDVTALELLVAQLCA